MPFITEELWQDIAERREGETIMYAASPKPQAYNPTVLENFNLVAEAVNGVRSVRNQKNIAPKENLHLVIKESSFPNVSLIEKMAGVNVEMLPEFGDAQAVGFMVRTHEMFVKMDGLVNVEEEIEKAEKDLEHQQKFLQGVRAKLSNERFVANAPAAVIENERKKEADALSKIESLEAKIKSLKKTN